MKNKKLIIIFLSSLIAFSAFAKDSEGNNSIFEELFEPRTGLFIDTAVTKPLVGRAADELTYGMGLSVELFGSYISLKVGLDLHTYNWDMINRVYYLPAEFGLNFNLPISLGALMIDPFAGAAGNICLWNSSPTYGFSWTGGVRLIVFLWGIKIYYKQEYLYPIRQKDSSISLGSLGVALTFFLDGSGF